VNAKAYIESGAIEAYVLGLATAEDAAELEQFRNQYAEVNDAVIAFEMQLEQTAMANAEAAPADVKGRLFATLNNEFVSEENESTKVVSLDNASAVAVKPIWKYLAAASIILLLVSAASNVYFYNEYQATAKLNKELVAQQVELTAQRDKWQTNFRLASDPAMKAVQMKDPNSVKDLVATVYWDTRTKDVYVVSNKLPQPQQGKQYQLWALVDGKPVDAGMMSDCIDICKMKNIPKAQTFAITLEKEGGSPTPDLTQLQVIGNVTP
jgi:anti-sigma-K factor RskA